MPILSFLRSARGTRIVRYLLDECLPPILRDRRWFYRPILRIYNRRMDPDFRIKAPFMTRRDILRAYEALGPIEQTDITPATLRFVLDHLVGPDILEVGCGKGNVSVEAARKGFRVVATDLVDANLTPLRNRTATEGLSLLAGVANVEQLPFAQRSFDTTICLHTLEHVPDLVATVGELRRVTRRRLIVLVPRERYHRYACNYHLHFFGDPEQLILTLRMRPVACRIIEDVICFAGDAEL